MSCLARGIRQLLHKEVVLTYALVTEASDSVTPDKLKITSFAAIEAPLYMTVCAVDCNSTAEEAGAEDVAVVVSFHSVDMEVAPGSTLVVAIVALGA
jgi:hypothetical protein